MTDDILDLQPTPDAPMATDDKKRKKRAALGELTIDEAKFIGIVDALVALKTKPELADDLVLSALTAHAAQIKSTRVNDAAALVERKAATSKALVVTKDAKTLMRRAGQWLAGQFPVGKDGHMDFLPPGPGPHDEGSRLAAFLSGLAKHPDAAKKLPPGLTVKDLTAMHTQLAVALKARVLASQAKDTTSVPKRATSLATAELLSQLVTFLRGWYGESSAELVQFGIKPRQRSR